MSTQQTPANRPTSSARYQRHALVLGGDLVDLSAFWLPEHVVESSGWLEHAPFAFWLVGSLNPRTLVELGTHGGYSYFAFCQAVERHHLETRCFAVDTWTGDEHAGFYGEEVFEGVSARNEERYGAFSTLIRSTFDEALSRFEDRSIDLLHIDGRHFEEDVRHDFETWRPKLSDRSVVLLHDTNVRERDFGVYRYYQQLAQQYPVFEFLHGNGLGVVKTGERTAPLLEALFSSAADTQGREALREVYASLGERINQRARASTLEAAVAEEHARAEQLQAALNEAHSSLATEQEAAVTAHRRIADLEASLAAERVAAAELGRSLADVRLAWEQTRKQEDADRALLQDRDRLLNLERGVSDFLRREVARMTGSRSWRVTQPLRSLGSGVRNARRSVQPRLHRISVEPMSEIERNGGRFRSTGHDPQLRVISSVGVMPNGLVKIRLRGRRADGAPFEPLLYIDAGSGFAANPIRISASTAAQAHFYTLPPRVMAFRLDPMDEPGEFTIESMEIQEVSPVAYAARRAVQVTRSAGSDPRGVARSARSAYRAYGWRGVMSWLGLGSIQSTTYARWVLSYDTLTNDDREQIRTHIASMAYRPVISVVMPVFNSNHTWLRRAIDSVLAQLYPQWELCIADDASTDPGIGRILARYAASDPRIRVIRNAEHGHISKTSNAALALASGEFVTLLDHDDELPEHSLYCIAGELNDHPDTDLLFSDEDKIDERGRRHDPYFKSDWNPDLMLSQNAFNHLGVYRRSLIHEIGCFREGFEGSQDYDLVLRASERTTPERIRHVPRVLYHWRDTPGSTARAASEKDYPWQAGRAAIAEHLERVGVAAEVLPAANGAYYRVRHPLPDPPPRVSLVIPTRDRIALLRRCVDGLLHRTHYPDMEIIIVDNESREPETKVYLDELTQHDDVRVVAVEGAFNFSRLNNVGVRTASGTIVGLVNNDIDVIESDWLREMVSHAVRPGIGAVGALLLYPDDTIQHAGVVVGIGGVAGHIYKRMDSRGFGYFGRAALVQNLSAVTAACLVTRRDLYLETGGLNDVDLPVAFNDIDFCLRLRERGYLNVWTPFARLYHLESASRGSDDTAVRKDGFAREIAHMQHHWGELLDDDPYYSPNLSLASEQPAPAFPPRVQRPWRSAQSLGTARRRVREAAGMGDADRVS